MRPAASRHWQWPGDSGLEFNLSHSNGLALLATSWDRAVGIDLESQGKELDFLGIADRFFTPQELAQIRGSPRRQPSGRRSSGAGRGKRRS